MKSITFANYLKQPLFPIYHVVEMEYIYRALILTWINLNPSMVKESCASEVWDEITCPFPNFNSCNVEIKKWISNSSHTL